MTPHPQSAAVRLPGKVVVNVDGHAVHALAPAVFEYAPAGHCTHALALLAPATPENAPAEQFVHESTLLAPVTPEYFPATQFTHALAPAAEYAPAEQSVHAALPLVVLNFPATQAVHGPPVGPVKPALQGAATH